jgi:hypothetical protein
MFDPRIGAVAGIVKAGIEPAVLQRVGGVPGGRLSFGPGAAPLSAFVHHAAPDLELSDQNDTGGDALDEVRRATVHVLCWR